MNFFNLHIWTILILGFSFGKYFTFSNAKVLNKSENLETIYVDIFDEETGTGLNDCHFLLQRKNYDLNKTDAHGKIIINGVPIGERNYIIVAEGYETKTGKIQVNLKGENSFPFHLKKSCTHEFEFKGAVFDFYNDPQSNLKLELVLENKEIKIDTTSTGGDFSFKLELGKDDKNYRPALNILSLNNDVLEREKVELTTHSQSKDFYIEPNCPKKVKIISKDAGFECTFKNFYDASGLKACKIYIVRKCNATYIKEIDNNNDPQIRTNWKLVRTKSEHDFFISPKEEVTRYLIPEYYLFLFDCNTHPGETQMGHLNLRDEDPNEEIVIEINSQNMADSQRTYR